MFKTIICGNGEIGKSLEKVLFQYSPTIIDKEGVVRGNVDGRELYILHICFPFSDKFEEAVIEYQEEYKPKYTVIHSTCPVGTSRKLGAVHHPCIGMHPQLAESFLTFTQFLSGENASEVSEYFRKAGMKVYLFDKQETTELGKISQTTFYALMIEYIKMLKEECDKNNVTFSETYTLMSIAYNEGYEKLGYAEYKMPLLIPVMTKQKGHCTLNNLPFWDNEFVDIIKKRNGLSSELKEEKKDKILPDGAECKLGEDDCMGCGGCDYHQLYIDKE